MYSVNQDAHIRTVFLRFRACSPKHQDRYHEDCPKCIAHGEDVVCSNPKHTDKECPVCDLINGRLAGVSPMEEATLVNRVRDYFKGMKA